MSQFHSAQHSFDQVGLARLKGWNLRPQRRDQLPIHSAALAQSEQVHPNGALKKIFVSLHNLGLLADGCQSGVGGGKQMIMNAADRIGGGGIENPRAEIIGGLQWHVASVAIGLGLFRIIETAGVVAGNTAQQIGVVVILTAQEFFVVIQILRDADLVAGGAKLGLFVQRLEKRLLVKVRLGLDQLLVQVLKKRVRAEGKRIVNRLFDGVVGIAPCAVHMSDGMAGGAGDARLGRRMIHVVKFGVIESSAEKGHDIMATGAPAGRLDVAIALERNLAGLTNTEQVGLVVE